MNNKDIELKKVVTFDIPDILLRKCILIPEEGMRINGSSLVAKPIGRDDKRFATKTYADPYSNKERSSTTFITASGKTYVTRGNWIIPFLIEAGYTMGTYYEKFVPNDEPDLSDIQVINLRPGDSLKGYYRKQAKAFFAGEQSSETFRIMREAISPEIITIPYVENKSGELSEATPRILEMIGEEKLNDSPFFGKIKAIRFISPYGEVMCKNSELDNK